ncbi:MAG: polysaccharide deacetylase [Rhodobacteraceae bacterium]|nr:polysaccharide deacetylase [Paracoccaceae bacterium]
MSDWQTISSGLHRLADAGTPLGLWWRDDDAAAPTPELDRLQALAARYDMAIHLAVIPAHATPTLREALAPSVIPVVHGFAHQSHAAAGEKNTEFSDDRGKDAICADLQLAVTLMADLQVNYAPVFVPPWNRIGPYATALLPDFGFRYLSTYNARSAVWATSGVEQVNTHVDPIEWRGSRSLVPQDRLLARISFSLAARLDGIQDPTEPFGLLTHHLIHDAAIRDFTDRFLEVFLTAPISLWTAARKREPG